MSKPHVWSALMSAMLSQAAAPAVSRWDGSPGTQLRAAVQSRGGESVRQKASGGGGAALQKCRSKWDHQRVESPSGSRCQTPDGGSDFWMTSKVSSICSSVQRGSVAKGSRPPACRGSDLPQQSQEFHRQRLLGAHKYAN